MSSLPPDKPADFTASDILSADAWSAKVPRPAIGVDVACTKIAVDFQNMRKEGVADCLRRNLELLREASATDCAFLLEEPGGAARRVDMKAGAAYRRAAGVEHNVVNGGAAPMSFVEVELKG